MVYDWANSAFFTTIVGVLIGPYLLGLASAAVGEEGVILDLGLFTVTPKGLPAFCTAISVVSMVVFLPVLGAIADYTHLKKSLMAFFCYAGVLAAGLLFFVTESYIACSVLLILSTMFFAATNVFYNAFLIDITTEDQRDKVSSYGYGLGYLSGFLMLVLNLIFISDAESLGFSTGQAVRICFLAAALWWERLRNYLYAAPERGRCKGAREQEYRHRRFSELWQTLKRKRLRYTMLFLCILVLYDEFRR